METNPFYMRHEIGKFVGSGSGRSKLDSLVPLPSSNLRNRYVQDELITLWLLPTHIPLNYRIPTRSLCLGFVHIENFIVKMENWVIVFISLRKEIFISTPKRRKLCATPEHTASPQSAPQKTTFDRPPSMAYLDDLEELQRTLRYMFQDVQILQHALTFDSEGTNSFERLEFLGDGTLGNSLKLFIFSF